MLKLLSVLMILSLGLGCAKKKTTNSVTQRQTVAQQKAKAEAEAKAKADAEIAAKAQEEALKVENEKKALQAKAESEAAEKRKKDEELKRAEALPAPVKAVTSAPAVKDPMPEPPPKPVTTEKPAATAPEAKPKSTVTFDAPPEGAEKPSASVPQVSQQKITQARNRLDQEAQKAEKSDMTNVKPGTPEEEWSKVIDYIKEKGAKETSGLQESYVSLIDRLPDNPKDPNVFKAISVVGALDKNNGQFNFGRMSAVWEDWTINKDGHLEGILWQFILGRDGTMARCIHKKLVKDKMDYVKLDQGIEITDADAQKKWQELKAFWVHKIIRNK